MMPHLKYVTVYVTLPFTFGLAYYLCSQRNSCVPILSFQPQLVWSFETEVFLQVLKRGVMKNYIELCETVDESNVWYYNIMKVYNLIEVDSDEDNASMISDYRMIE